MYGFHLAPKYCQVLLELVKLPNIQVDTTNADGKTLIFLAVEMAAERFKKRLDNGDMRELLRILGLTMGADVNRMCGPVSISLLLCLYSYTDCYEIEFGYTVDCCCSE